MFSTPIEELDFLFFDLDGVLLDSLSAGMETFRKLFFKIHGRQMTEAENKKLDEVWGQHITTIVGLLYPDKSQKELLNIWHSLESKDEIKLFPHASYVLDLLTMEGLEVGIATNRPLLSILKICPDILEANISILQTYAINNGNEEKDSIMLLKEASERNLDVKIFMSDYCKPFKNFFKESMDYLKELGFEKEKIGLIGDTKIDLQAAQAMDFGFFGGVNTGPMKVEDWQEVGLKKDNIFESIYDFYFCFLKAL